ncbi:MAG: hypothetical protein R6U30_02680 [Halomonas sp.]
MLNGFVVFSIPPTFFKDIRLPLSVTNIAALIRQWPDRDGEVK